ncbi:MAG: DNA-directed RNA polymerase subunit beta, partial [Clostridia bacterium]|nr:DNA-directed RNA polymerase subunit beta [Clostridia bacterium]
MSFSKIEAATEMPNLIEVQKDSYDWFLKEGLAEVLKDVSPIVDFTGNLSIEFTDYTLDPTPRYSVEECKDRSVTYDAHMKVGVRLVNKETGEIKTAQIFLGDFPLMTDNGTFVINGAERVIVSQLIRSPGMYYVEKVDKAGKHLIEAQVIPYRGAWLEYETDSAGVFYVKIDKNRKIPVTVLIRALCDSGKDTDEALFEMYGDEDVLRITMAKDECRTLAEESNSSQRDEALKEIYKKIRPGEPPIVESAEILMHNLFFDPKKYDLGAVGRYKFNKKVALAARIRGFVLAEDVVNPVTGEIVAEAGQSIDKELAERIENSLVNSVVINIESGRAIKVFGNDTVLPEAYLGFDLVDCGVRAGEKVRFSVIKEIVDAADSEGLDGEARVSFIKKSVVERFDELCPKHITKEDILASINYMIALSHGVGVADDIDHLGNRRLRCVGELLQQQMRIGMIRMDKNIRERMSTHDSEDLRIEALINTRPVATAIREFFGSSPLSQFMDQSNPLAELTHKRRLSALGPGGLSRDRASFEVRDVHYTHYGRICPVETPEGPNIGLISYLASYAKISEYGFLKAPYRIVENGRVTDKVVYLTADEEDNNIVAQANEMLDENGNFVNKKVIARLRTEFIEVSPEQVDLMDA